MNQKVSLSIKNEFKEDVSQNVIAMLPGTTQKDEYIIYTGHWDHLGIGNPVEGDSIYNGAMDNASGISSILAIAKAFSELDEKPKRSVLFLAVTSEEQGLLGSAHYAANPIFPVQKTVANLNIDMLSSMGEMKDLTITGFGQSELDAYAEEAAKTQGRYVMANPKPGAGYFFRSDHFNFAKVGIPALYGKGVYEHKEKGKDYAKKKTEEFNSTNYHRPSDEYDPSIHDLGGILQDSELYFQIGLRLSNESTFPKWKEGSEFKSVRAKSLQQ